jgi:hypothetical protein
VGDILAGVEAGAVEIGAGVLVVLRDGEEGAFGVIVETALTLSDSAFCGVLGSPAAALPVGPGFVPVVFPAEAASFPPFDSGPFPSLSFSTSMTSPSPLPPATVSPVVLPPLLRHPPALVTRGASPAGTPRLDVAEEEEERRDASR